MLNKLWRKVFVAEKLFIGFKKKILLLVETTVSYSNDDSSPIWVLMHSWQVADGELCVNQSLNMLANVTNDMLAGFALRGGP